ncbi:sporulation membrane protein YtaF [Salinithrix halophila]|uniref:Sporulation membrane protein YtaF n=1 Tax=Salinithrix halophila TaxID=1485204 RepID=A0ABV8JA29_9BACL
MWAVMFYFMLALAVSLDSFGAGITYGLRSIRIPLTSIVIIGGCSGGMVGLSMHLTAISTGWLPKETTTVAGAVILIGLGLFALYNAGRPDSQAEGSTASPSGPIRVFSWEIKGFGIVIQILKSPVAADRDSSGILSPTEACLLGFALSLDAFGAGMGAALLGFSPWAASSMIALMSVLFLVAGLKTGIRFRSRNWLPGIAYIPGILLILMGFFRFF